MDTSSFDSLSSCDGDLVPPSTVRGVEETATKTVKVSIRDVEDFLQQSFAAFRQLDVSQKLLEGPFTTEKCLRLIMERYLHQSIDTETERGERTFSDIFPLGISQIPTLLYISELQYAITAKVLSAIATRPIVTVFDVERELCDEYDVKQFRDFGIADALHHLPIVQLYFKVEKDTDVLPVTGSEVMDYVLLNDEAAGILQSNGDSIDIAYHFCRFYADKTNQPYHRVRLNRLGLHIQNLTKFLHHMRAEIAESGQCIHRLIHSQKLRASKNAVLYTRLLSALDAQLSCRPPVAGDDLEFAVGMTREEAQCTTLPMSVFCPANAPVGGVEIRLCVKSPNQTTTESAVRLSSTNTGVGGTAQLGGGNTHGRRNKTYVDTTSTPVASGSATADVLSFLQPKGLTTTPIVKSIPTLETTVETVSEPSHPIVPNADPGQVLEQFLQDDQGLVAETYWRAVDALSALQVGRRVSLELLRGVFRKLSRFISTHSGGGAFLEELRERIRIPVPQVGVTSPSQSGITIAALSPIAGVCWESPSSVDLEECRLLARAQRPMYADLKLFFCEQLGISVLPTTQVWLQFVETLRCGGPPISDGVEKQILNLLCGCVEDDFSERLAHCKVEGPAACKAALTSLLSSLPPDLPLRYMFPLQGRWRRAVDDLYFAGSTYFGLSGTYLESSNGAHKESPLVLHFSGKGPHFAVDAFLSHAGVCAVERCVKKAVLYNGDSTLTDATSLYRQLEVMVPYVQSFLAEQFPTLYHISYDLLQRRLGALSVVCGSRVSLRSVLRSRTGVVYTMEAPLSFNYLEQYNMVYAEVNTNFTNHVKAVVFRDVFLPLTPSAEVQRQLTDVLQTIFSVFSTIGDNVFANGPSPDDERFLRHSLDKALRPYNVRPYAITNETQLPAFTVSTSKSSKFRNHCPNGLGALHYPKWAVGAGKHHRAGGGGLDPATLQNHLPQWVEDLTVQPVTPSAEERVSEHKGTPDDDRADENEGFIVIHPSSRKRHREEGKVGFSSYPTEAERYVYHSLQSEMADDKSVSVLWVNEEKEAGTPYDIVVYRQDKSGTREVLFYVEVKSTTSSSKKNFEMSIGELIMSARYGKQYKIYRVFNAELLSMKGNGKVKIYEDVIGLWRQSKLTLSGEIRVMPTF